MHTLQESPHFPSQRVACRTEMVDNADRHTDPTVPTRHARPILIYKKEPKILVNKYHGVRIKNYIHLRKKLTAGFCLVELEPSRLVPPRQQHRHAPRPESTVLCVRLRKSHAPCTSSKVRAGPVVHMCVYGLRQREPTRQTKKYIDPTGEARKKK